MNGGYIITAYSILVNLIDYVDELKRLNPALALVYSFLSSIITLFDYIQRCNGIDLLL
jgi:hypothetical protein